MCLIYQQSFSINNLKTYQGGLKMIYLAEKTQCKIELSGTEFFLSKKRPGNTIRHQKFTSDNNVTSCSSIVPQHYVTKSVKKTLLPQKIMRVF